MSQTSVLGLGWYCYVTRPKKCRQYSIHVHNPVRILEHYTFMTCYINQRLIFSSFFEASKRVGIVVTWGIYKIMDLIYA